MAKFRRIPQRNKEPEKVIGYLQATQANTFSNLLTNTELVTAPNDLVPIAKCIRTAGNVARYRLFGTIIWVSEADGFVDINGIKTNVSEVLAEKTDNQLNVSQISDTNKITDKKTKTRTTKSVAVTTNIINNISTGKSKHMDKTQLRNLFSTLTAGQNLEITFGGARAHLSGSYSIERVRRGRGKGGSRLLDLTSLTGGAPLTTGTPDSGTIVNVTVNGERFGLDSAADLPVVFGRNRTISNEFKRLTKSILAARKADAAVVQTLTVESDVPEFAGTFSVVGAQRCRGRGGPCRLDLSEVGTGRAVTLWSSRHSGAIRALALA